MIQNVLRNLGGIETVGILSIVLFFVCFAGVLFWAFGLKKEHLDSMSRLPLEPDPAAAGDSAQPSDSDTRHE